MNSFLNSVLIWCTRHGRTTDPNDQVDDSIDKCDEGVVFEVDIIGYGYANVSVYLELFRVVNDVGEEVTEVRIDSSHIRVEHIPDTLPLYHLP